MRQGKIRTHEPSLRVPFVVAGPGIPHGPRFDPVTTEDVTATILDLAGARAAAPADGVSVVPSFAARPGLEGAGAHRGPVDGQRVQRRPATRRRRVRTTPGPRSASAPPAGSTSATSTATPSSTTSTATPTSCTTSTAGPGTPPSRPAARVWLRPPDCAGATLPRTAARRPADGAPTGRRGDPRPGARCRGALRGGAAVGAGSSGPHHTWVWSARWVWSAWLARSVWLWPIPTPDRPAERGVIGHNRAGPARSATTETLGASVGRTACRQG